jgi:uncharacterized protein with ATP-grasp and redox domains
LLRQAHEAIALATSDARRRETALRQTLRFLNRLDWSASPPALAQRLHAFIRQAVGDPDPYAEVKVGLNQRAMGLFPTWGPRFHSAFPPLEAAVRLAIVGNVLDLGAKTQLSEEAVLAAFEEGLKAPLRGSVEALASAIRHARHILYLADNAGEIVFDRDLMAQLPIGGFTVVVRGGPILNDATLADAEETGVTVLGDVMSNGSDAPGTLLEDCSGAFLARFAEADLVLAKGQGNFESLTSVEKPVFHLLKVKCGVVARALGCPRGSLVLHSEEARAGPCR